MMERGQVWNCSDPDCGGQVLVIRASSPKKNPILSIRCGCGREMSP